MSTNAQPNGSGGTPNNSPAANGGNGKPVDEQIDDVIEVPEDEADDKKVVKYSTYKKAVVEAKNAKAKLREIEDQRRLDEEKKLQETNDYKKLYDTKKQEAEETAKKYQSLLVDINNANKVHAFEATLKGKVKPEYHGFIDVDAILIDPETNEIDQASVAKQVALFQKKHPELVMRTDGTPARSPAPQGETSPDKIKRSEWSKLTAKEMWKWKPDQIIEG